MLASFNQRLIILIAEFLAVCIIVPGIIIAFRIAPFMFAFLWGAALYAYLILRYVEKLSLKTIWNWQAVTWQNLRPILIRFIGCTAAMVAFCLWYDPERFLFLPQTRPEFVLLLCCIYPLLSALPQELIFCSFFFRRYGPLFGVGLRVVAASAIVFAYAHILYINWIAPTLSLIGGLIFADTYRRHHSLALVTIEHGLYSNALFIIGLGWYFYGGAVVASGG